MTGVVYNPSNGRCPWCFVFTPPDGGRIMIAFQTFEEALSRLMREASTHEMAKAYGVR